MLTYGGSGLRLHRFDLSQELEKKRPFHGVAELHLDENLLQPEQVSSGISD